MAKYKVRKLIRLVGEGNPSKLKLYIRKHKVIVNTIRLDYGQSLLHLACNLGQDDSLRILLKLGADPLVCDNNGNLPIHLAARTVLNGKQYAFSDLVLPLIQHSPQSLDLTNKEGETARFLLHNVQGFLQHPDNGVCSQRGQAASGVWEDDERAWAEKLVDEWQDEYNATWGYFERSDYEKPKETFDEWADRLSREYAGKNWKRKLHTDHSESSKRQRTTNEPLPPLRDQPSADEYFERLAQLKQECLKNKKLKYEKRCQEVFNIQNLSSILCYDDVPWPTGNQIDDVMEVLLCDLGCLDVTTRRKYLREQQVQWHPDRFMQRCGKRLLARDAECILSRVKEISQIINCYIEQSKV